MHTSNIIANLKNFGLENLEVTAKVTIICGLKERHVETDKMTLTNLITRLHEDPRFIERDSMTERIREIMVRQDGKVIGTIFDTTFLPIGMDTKTTVSWILATSIGKWKVLNVDVRQFSEGLKAHLRSAGISKSVFFGIWKFAIREVFNWNGEAHCLATTPIWRAVTREVTGREHEGYHFLY